MEQVVMLSPATLDLTVGNLPFGPTLVDRQVAETELAQLLFLHLLQPLPGRQFRAGWEAALTPCDLDMWRVPSTAPFGARVP